MFVHFYTNTIKEGSKSLISNFNIQISIDAFMTNDNSTPSWSEIHVISLKDHQSPTQPFKNLYFLSVCVHTSYLKVPMAKPL